VDEELRALLAAQSRLIAELTERLAPRARVLPLAELYAQHEIAQKHRPGWKTNAFMLRPIVKLLGARDCAGLLVADWTAYRVSRDDLAPTSLNLALRCLKAMLRWGKREGLLSVVPQLCDAGKLKQKAHRETAPTEADVGKLLDACVQPRDRVIVLCACDSGMRNTEIRLLEWSWVKRDKMEIDLPAAITKSRKARSVPMTRRELAAIDAMPRDIRSPLVLRSSRTGEALTQSWMSILFRQLAAAAEIKAVPGERRVHLHDGRHGFATNAAERGVRIEVLSEILGHASLEQTRAYVSRRKGDLAAARVLFEAGIVKDSGR
jgi:integrase